MSLNVSDSHLPCCAADGGNGNLTPLLKCLITACMQDSCAAKAMVLGCVTCITRCRALSLTNQARSRMGR